MTRFKLYYDKEKEVNWLNEMAKHGWACKGFFAGFYSFEPCKDGEYLFQKDTAERFGYISDEYRNFMQETGTEIVTVWGPWVLLRRKASMGAFELYTDIESKIAYLKKQRKIFKIAIILEIICMWIELYCGWEGVSAGYGASLLLAVIILFMVRRVSDLTRKIHELMEERGETPSGRVMWNKSTSVFLALGFLLNLIVYLIKDSSGDFTMSFCRGLQMVACILLVIGLVLLYRNNREES